MALSLENKIKHLQWALGEAATVFREYEKLHLAKASEEGNKKAQRNRFYAQQCENAIRASIEG